MTPEFLQKAVTGCSKANAEKYVTPLYWAMAEFGIDTKERCADFLAQIGHESLGLMYTKELASGEAYDTGILAARLGNTVAKDGDGQFYKGGSFMQITGARNYLLCLMALDLDLLNHPELLQQPEACCRATAWFWYNERLNDYTDHGDFKGQTKRINGGLNGFEDRLARRIVARKAYGLSV